MMIKFSIWSATTSMGLRVILALMLSSITLEGFPQFQAVPVQISNNLTDIQGKTYYLHEVKQGHTLYSIARAYRVTQEEVRRRNPILLEKSLAPGMVLLIPYQPIEEAVIYSLQDTIHHRHIIGSKETWFSISRIYGIKVANLKESNPKFGWGLTAGDTLLVRKDLIPPGTRIPEPVMVEKVKTVVTPAKKDSTALMVVEKTPTIKDIRQARGSETKVALFLPLQNSMVDPMLHNDTLQPDLRFWEFLQGAYLAVDSVAKDGYPIDLKVFDTERSVQRMEQIIRSGELDQVDLIIGPVYPQELSVIARYASDKRIPLVSPLSGRADVLKGNPYVFQANPSQESQMIQTATYLSARTQHHLVILAPFSDRSNQELLELAGIISNKRSNYAPDPNVGFLFYNQASKQFKDRDSVHASLYTTMKAGHPNLVILPTEDEAFATEIVNRLKLLPETYQISIFGTPSWSEFTNIDIQYLFDLNLEYPSNFSYPFIDYLDPHVLDFCKLYHKNWSSEPSRFSFQGFDITLYFLKQITVYQENKKNRLEDIERAPTEPALLTPFHFLSTGRGNGFENQAVPVIRYNNETLTRQRIEVVRSSERNP